MFNKVSKTFQYGQQTVTMETGEIARQASGAVIVSVEDTVVLATVVAKDDAKPGQDFFPLTVDYIEKTYGSRSHPGQLFQTRRPSIRKGNPDVPSDRPSYPSAFSRKAISMKFRSSFMSCPSILKSILTFHP